MAKSGIKEYTAGTANLITGMKQYISGTDQLAVGAKKLKALENLGQITTAVQKLTAAVNGDGSGQDLTTGSAQLTEGLKELKTQVDELAQSSNAQQLTQLVQGLQQAKASLKCSLRTDCTAHTASSGRCGGSTVDQRKSQCCHGKFERSGSGCK